MKKLRTFKWERENIKRKSISHLFTKNIAKKFSIHNVDPSPDNSPVLKHQPFSLDDLPHLVKNQTVKPKVPKILGFGKINEIRELDNLESGTIESGPPS